MLYRYKESDSDPFYFDLLKSLSTYFERTLCFLSSKFTSL